MNKRKRNKRGGPWKIQQSKGKGRVPRRLREKHTFENDFMQHAEEKHDFKNSLLSIRENKRAKLLHHWSSSRISQEKNKIRWKSNQRERITKNTKAGLTLLGSKVKPWFHQLLCVLVKSPPSQLVTHLLGLLKGLNFGHSMSLRGGSL